MPRTMYPVLGVFTPQEQGMILVGTPFGESVRWLVYHMKHQQLPF